MRDVWEAGVVGRISEAEVAVQVGARLGLGEREVEAFMGDLWAQYLGAPNEELIGYVRELRGRCRLVILSNSCVGARERECARYGFDELVGEIVYSHEIGVAKPDPRAFRAVCAALELEPARCLLVDDVGANVAGARAAGMRGHLFEDNSRAVACIEGHLGAV
jgi:putative hydrolase of the HAD superfamily